MVQKSMRPALRYECSVAVREAIPVALHQAGRVAFDNRDGFIALVNVAGQ